MKEQFKKQIERLVDEGFRVFISPDKHWQTYAFVIKGDRVASFQENKWGHGFDISIIYKPSREHGNACQFIDEVQEVTPELIEQAMEASLDSYNPPYTSFEQIKTKRLDRLVEVQS